MFPSPPETRKQKRCDHSHSKCVDGQRCNCGCNTCKSRNSRKGFVLTRKRFNSSCSYCRDHHLACDDKVPCSQCICNQISCIHDNSSRKKQQIEGNRTIRFIDVTETCTKSTEDHHYNLNDNNDIENNYVSIVNNNLNSVSILSQDDA